MTDELIPIINIAPFRRGWDPQGKQSVAQQVAHACKEIGFLMIVGHGVSEELIQDMYRVSHQFFKLPLTEKQQVAMPSGIYRGYAGVGDEILSYSLGQAAPPDLRESLVIGPVDIPQDPYYYTSEADSSFAPNLWPQQPEALQQIWTDYYQAMQDLAATLLQIFAVALEMPENFFTPKIDRAMSCLAVRHYPPQADPPLPGQLRTGAHSDYGSLSILHQDCAPGGLQILDKFGNWQDVPPYPGAFLVNLGDLLARWTNDHWVSTLHRVVNPPRQLSASSRMSIPFFHNPNYDALVTCLETCCGPDNPPRYPPITAGEHIWRKTWLHRDTKEESRQYSS